jgi:CHRD domain
LLIPNGRNCMTTSFVRSNLAALACAALFTLASPAMAATVNLKADLKAASEVPPTDSKGTGSVTATFDTASKNLSWKGTVSGLTGPATAAHFHAGEAGKNGGVVVPIAGADKGSFEGSATLTDAQAAELMDGKWYVNVHTAANKGGEVRGQVTK